MPGGNGKRREEGAPPGAAGQADSGGSWDRPEPRGYCFRCGEPLVHVHCKFICLRCGYRMDCSDY